MKKLEDRFRETEEFTPSLIWLNVGETLGSFVRVAFFKVIEPFTNKSLMLSRPGKLLMMCSPPFPPAPTVLLFIYNTDSLSLKKISCRVVRTSSPRKQVDEKCSFKRRYSPRWHFCSPWSNVLRELSLEAAHQLSLQLLKTPYQRKLINGPLKAQSYHQVGGCSFHCSVWGWRIAMLSNVRCLFPAKIYG